MKIEISQKQINILVFCSHYIRKFPDDFYPPLFPTLEEITKHSELKSRSTVLHHINNLVEVGYLSEYFRGKTERRRFGITKKGLALAKEKSGGSL